MTNCFLKRGLFFLGALAASFSLQADPVFTDGSFGASKTGVVTISKNDQVMINAIQIDGSGNIIVSGSMLKLGMLKLFAARFLPSGELDTSYGTNGFVASIGSGTLQGADGALDSSERLLIVGTGPVSPTQNGFIAARYTTAGIVDGTFGTGGLTTITIGDGAEVNAVALQADQKILLGGLAVSNGASAFAIARLDANGVIDGTYGTSGVTTTSIGFTSYANALAIQSDGKSVLGGTAINPDNGFALARYDTSGVLDAGFGTAGIVYEPIVGGQLFGLAVQSDQKILAVGAATGSTVSSEAVLMRFNTDGTLDSGFGTSGVVRTAVGTITQAQTVQIDGSGNIVVAGYSDTQIFVARYLAADGSIDTSFGEAGVVTLSVGKDARAQDVALQSNGRIVVAGVSETNGLMVRLFDTNSAQITISTPVNGSTINTFTAQVTGVATVSNALIDVYVNSVLYESVTTDANGNWSTTTAPLFLLGSNTVEAQLNSNPLVTDSITFTVTATDTITITSPENAVPVLFNPQPTISGTSTRGSKTVDVYIDGSFFSTVATDSEGNWATGPSPLLNLGSHTIVANLMDGVTQLATTSSMFGAFPINVVQGAINLSGGIGSSGSGPGYSFIVTSSNSVSITFTVQFAATPTVITSGQRSSGSSTVTVSAVSTASTTLSYTTGTQIINFSAYSL